MTSLIYLWLLVAIVSVFAELATTSFAALCFAFGGLVAALLAWIGVHWAWQIVAFCVATLLGFAVVRPLALRYIYGGRVGDKVPTNADALIGRVGIVTESIEPATTQGLVKTDGDVWAARSASGVPIAQGQQVRIVRRESIVMYVEPLA